jgi:hypothetical protein
LLDEGSLSFLQLAKVNNTAATKAGIARSEECVIFSA